MGERKKEEIHDTSGINQDGRDVSWANTSHQCKTKDMS